MKTKDRGQKYGNDEEDSKGNASTGRVRKTRSSNKRRGTRTNYTKYYEDDDQDIDIPKEYQSAFEAFKGFIDDLNSESPQEEQPTKTSKKRYEKGMIGISDEIWSIKFDF
jgi:hypothetical protein